MTDRTGKQSEIDRRAMLRWAAGLGGTILTSSTELFANQLPEPPKEVQLKWSREQLLDEIEKRACKFFFEQTDPKSGLTMDRARMDGQDDRKAASIAATGFALSAMCIGDRRGYFDRGVGRTRVEAALESLVSRVPHERGFYPHFLHVNTGERIWGSEFSSIDTCWLLCGVLHARAHFNTPVISRLATELIDRTDWQWMLNGSKLISHGWTPEGGFLPYSWNQYSEMLAMYLLAIGSSTYPIDASSWDAWQRPVRTFEGLTYIDSIAPLFTHQYSHAFFDFRGVRDSYTNYFENSRLATEAHRRFCISLSTKFPWYGEQLWGVTASDSRRGYLAWGEMNFPDPLDGTLVPCAAGGSVAFLPDRCSAVLETMLNRFGKNVWGRYGFVDAFHPHDNWYNPDVLGIDQGIMMVMAENLRSQSVWQAIMTAPEARRAMLAVGFAPSV